MKNGSPGAVYPTNHYEVSRQVDFGSQPAIKRLSGGLGLLGPRDFFTFSVSCSSAICWPQGGHSKSNSTSVPIAWVNALWDWREQIACRSSLSLYLSHLFCSESFCNPLISFQPVQWVSCQIHRLKVANITLLVPLVTKLCFHNKKLSLSSASCFWYKT